MAKITLGNRPRTFKKEVTFPMLDGSEGSIEITFKYRTRKEYGAFVDDWQKQREERSRVEVQAKLQQHEAAAAAATEAGQEAPALNLITQAELQAMAVDASADYIMAIAEGWDVDAPFSVETIQQLCDETPSAGAAISTAYRVALTEARLGN